MILYGGFLISAVAPNHPFIDGIFHEVNHPALGVPPFQEDPILVIRVVNHVWLCLVGVQFGELLYPLVN